MNFLKTFRGNSVEELQYKKAKWLRSLAPTNKLEEEDIDLLAKLEANNMLEFYKEVSE